MGAAHLHLISTFNYYFVRIYRVCVCQSFYIQPLYNGLDFHTGVVQNKLNTKMLNIHMLNTFSMF